LFNQRKISGLMRSLGIVLIFSLWMVVPSVLAQPTPSPESESVIAECASLLAADRPMPDGSDAPAVRLIQPSSEVIYGSAVTIAIETNNFDVTSEGRHWHLWVNGQLQGMVYQPTAIIDLAPGIYTICASLGNTNHADIGMPAGMRITVEQPQVGTPTPTLLIAPEQAQVQPEASGPSGAQILLLVGGGLLAAVGGWWLGARMTGRKTR
jgi:hypothetical protein